MRRAGGTRERTHLWLPLDNEVEGEHPVRRLLPPRTRLPVVFAGQAHLGRESASVQRTADQGAGGSARTESRSTQRRSYLAEDLLLLVHVGGQVGEQEVEEGREHRRLVAVADEQEGRRVVLRRNGTQVRQTAARPAGTGGGGHSPTTGTTRS